MSLCSVDQRENCPAEALTRDYVQHLRGTMQTGSTATTSAPWNQVEATAMYRGTMQRMAAWWDAADVFDRPSLKRKDIVAADRVVQEAWAAQDEAALRQALALWERAVCGR